MTREEARRWLTCMKWVVLDTGHMVTAGEIEDAELRIEALTVEQAHEYAGLVLAPGRRGRVQIVLRPPYEARALSMLAMILRSVDS